MKLSFKCVAMILLVVILCGSAIADEPTAKEKRQVRSIASLIDRAGRLFKAKKFESSAEKIQDAMTRIHELAASADADLMKLIEPEFDRLAKARTLLVDGGQTLPELANLPAPMTGDGTAVSFTQQVAPIFVANCGRCHVRNNRGNFSAANYNALMNSTMVAAGIPADSRIIQVIEDGEMPPGGSVTEGDLATLKSWVQQGAKFDGDDATRGLNMLTGNQPPRNRPMDIQKPTGNETVSFGLHVAPVLLNACSQCHIETRNARGNFSMANFRNLLRGGDSGSPIVAGNSRNSILIKRLRGDGLEVMPPSGKLDDKVINRIATWIDEGAKFDGGDNPALGMRIVSATAKASSQTHKELSADRAILAQKNWKLIMSDVANETVETENFRMVGATMTERLEEIGSIIEKVIPKIESALRVKSDGDEPFIKGNTTVFVFERRYDFNELGVMLNGREIPREVDGYWDDTTVDAFASVLLTRNRKPDTVTANLAQQIAAIRVSAMAPDMPRWFADGMGYWAAAKALSKNDDVGKWDELASQAAATMESPGDFATGKMPEDLAALASYLFVKQLRSDSAKFSKLFRFMKEGYSFERSFTETFGKPPNDFFATERPRRRNR